ncbi:pyridoxamine 5'-phosphate oxidase family protein [Streptomyces griseoruber]|uniref:pyridoxamine 5'-phosphate oxidase family protein n=1 Tax=Streptomyces griseoruber TaxID=1943 RepID=UPI0037B84BBE
MTGNYLLTIGESTIRTEGGSLTGARKRGAAIARDTAEVDAFLRAQPVCRVAVTASDGHPHLSPPWFVGDGTALWLNSPVRSRRWADVVKRGRIAVVVDEGGPDFLELRGVEPRGGGTGGCGRSRRRWSAGTSASCGVDGRHRTWKRDTRSGEYDSREAS